MNYKTILLDQGDGVTTITLNRPQSYNALNIEMLQELLHVLDALESDPSTRAVLLTGAGRAFSSGGDLAGPLDPEIGGPADIHKLPADRQTAVLQRIGNKICKALKDNHNRLALKLHGYSKPTICAINGVAAGGAVGLALSCEIVVAAQSAKLIQVFTPQLAFVPDFGCSWHLTRLVGASRATALALLGDSIPAPEAERLGLIWKTFADDELAGAARLIATRIASNADGANARTRQALKAAQVNDLATQLDLEAELQGRCAATLDFIEGVLAFQQKRKPQFHRA
jgi:2-(1,2-epoxy-1,2-dihydrophenyl)acetyl-CoA isomerase